jgi:aconitate hydratase
LGSIDYSSIVEFDLAGVVPSLAGPKRPQDRVALESMGETFDTLFSKPVSENGFSKKAAKLGERYRTKRPGVTIGNGDVLIAAITSCTNTSNPGVLLAAGLLARKAVCGRFGGATPYPRLARPGSRVVTAYLAKAGSLTELEKLNLSGGYAARPASAYAARSTRRGRNGGRQRSHLCSRAFR